MTTPGGGGGGGGPEESISTGIEASTTGPAQHDTADKIAAILVGTGDASPEAKKTADFIAGVAVKTYMALAPSVDD